MITLDQIETAFGQALVAVPEVDRVVWPNRTDDPARPFVMFQHVPGAWTDRTVSGGDLVSEGTIQLTIVSKLNQFATPTNQLADAIIAAFPYGRRIAAGSGNVLITRPTRPIAAIRDGGDWRMTIEITYGTETA